MAAAASLTAAHAAVRDVDNARAVSCTSTPFHGLRRPLARGVSQIASSRLCLVVACTVCSQIRTSNINADLPGAQWLTLNLLGGLLMLSFLLLDLQVRWLKMYYVRSKY